MIEIYIYNNKTYKILGISKISYLMFFLLLAKFNLYSQIGGRYSYSFLEVPNSARLASLNCNLISVRDNDINTTVYNPSLITPLLHGNMGFSFLNYFADIKAGYASYAHNFKKVGTFVGSMQYFHYGRFIRSDESGRELGEFFAYDYAFNTGFAKPIDKDSLFNIGANVKFIFSWLESYTSLGIGCDMAINYYNKDSHFGATFLIRNLGGSLIPYTYANHEPMPIDIQLGISQKLKHAPFRYTINAVHLEIPVLKRNRPGEGIKIDPLTKDTIKEDVLTKYLTNIARHFLVGVEFIPSQTFSIRIGYNYRRAVEMKLEDLQGLVGFSWGFGIRISRFQLSYGRATYHKSASSNHFTITTRISDFF